LPAIRIRSVGAKEKRGKATNEEKENDFLTKSKT